MGKFMPIVVKDIFAAAKAKEIDVMIHGCNIQVNMGAGIAKLVRQKCPTAWNMDQRTVVDDVSKLGTINWVVCDDGLIVVNAYTQRYFGRLHKELNLDHMRGCFREVKRAFGGHGFSFGFPLIGCDRGKGDWKDVSPIIEEEMLGEKIALYILPGQPRPNR